MKKTKKFFVGLLAFASINAFTLGMVACKGGTDAGTLPPKEENTIEQVYDTYVEYATKKGQTPLDYETWLNTIKGADGVGIKSVEVDDDGMMIITLTDGTVLPAIELPTGEPIEKGATRNLHYQRIAGKEEYRVIGLGLASEQDIVISSTYNGLPVTEIGTNAFENETYITSIEIPDGVTTIGDGAFKGCSNLKSITIPDSVTMIGYAFEIDGDLNSNLKNVYYTGDLASWCELDFRDMIDPNGYDKGYYSCCTNPLFGGADLYINNEKVVDLVIPDGVKAINNYAFIGANFESVTIGNSVTTIGYLAFYECRNLTSVTIGNSVTTIGRYAFYGCDSLTSVTIPDSVTTIGYWAFSDTTYIEKFSYVIYVMDENGEAMADVQIGICDYDTGRCTTPKKTDENGKVVFKEIEATYVLNSNVSTPSGYEWKESYEFTEYGEYTVVLVKAD